MSIKKIGRQINMVYNPQSLVMLPMMTAQTALDDSIVHHGIVVLLNRRCEKIFYSSLLATSVASGYQNSPGDLQK